MTASAVSQHLKVLRDAGLVAVRKAGRERLYRLNADPLREVAEWASTYERFWTERMDRLGTYLEKKAAPPNPSPGRQEQEQKTP